MIKKNNFVQKNRYGKKLIILIISLLVFGLLIIYNATSYFSQSTFGNPFRFVYLQSGWIFFGMIGFLFFSNFNHENLKKLTSFITFVSIIILLLLAIVGFFVCKQPQNSGLAFIPCVNGASRWLFINPPPLPQIPFIGTIGFQPGELAKLAVILYLSAKLSEFQKNEKNMPFIIFVVTGIIFSFLLLLQPNMSTAILVFCICIVVYFTSGHSLKYLFLTSPLFLLTMLGAVLSSSYRRERFLTLLGLIKGKEQETGYHIKQVLIALGTGGFFGVGFGQSRQKFQYLPEISSDSIFAIIGEEFGFIGTTLVILAFGYLIYLGFQIAKNASDPYGKMLAMGVISWLGIQFFINIAAMVGLIPLTGIPIPLISYGGSSMVFSLSALGILLNIDKKSN